MHRPTFRWLGEGIFYIQEVLVTALYSLSMRDVSSSPWFSGSPWPVGADLDSLVAGPAIPVTTLIVFVLTCLLPLAYVAKTWFAPLWLQLTFFCVTFGTLVGWPPVVETLFFDFLGLFADWPRSYFLFTNPLLVHDYAAIAVVVCQFLYLTYRQNPPILELIVILVLSHGAYDYLGMVFGFAYAATAFSRGFPEGWKPVAWTILKRLIFSGVVVIAIAGVNYWVYFAVIGELLAITDVELLGGVSRYIDNNILWFRSIIANMITLIVLSLAAGGIIGLLHRVLAGGKIEDWDQYRRELCIAGGIFVGFMITFAVGFIAVPYPSDMGRQYAPLMVICVMIAARVALGFRAKSRYRP